MIEVSNISIKFRNARAFALSDISFIVGRGEYIAVLGPNGSGKSTLIKALCGFVPVDTGEIRIFGKRVRYGGFGHDFFGEIGVVFQEPQGQFLARDVRTELMSILQNLGLSLSTQKERFDEIVRDFDLEQLLDIKPENLSGGQMQLVNLAGAMCLDPKLLLIDEPTTFLDTHHKSEFLSQISRLNKKGLTIIHVTQYPDEAIPAQRVIILYDGFLVCDGPAGKILDDEKRLRANKLIKPVEMTFSAVFGFRFNDKQQIDQYIRKIERPEIAGKDFYKEHDSAPAVEVEKLKFSYDDNKFMLGIDKLSLHAGEIVGLVGPGGSGKSTLAFLMAGLLKPESGNVSIAGRELSEYGIADLRNNIGITWQLPDLTLIGPTVKDDLEFGMKNEQAIAGDISATLRKVGLDGFEDRIVDTLSGGEKRKLAIASILLARPQFLIMDEPEAFLDPWSQCELANIIKKIAAENRGILLIAHDLYFLSEIADRIIGLNKGKIAFDVAAGQFFSDRSYLDQLGLPGNFMIEFRQKIVKAGISLTTASLDPMKIENTLN